MIAARVPRERSLEFAVNPANAVLCVCGKRPTGAAGMYPRPTTSASRNSTANFGLSDGNTAGGIRSVVVQPNGFMYSCQYQFTPAIPKDDTKTLSLTFSCSWARRP